MVLLASVTIPAWAQVSLTALDAPYAQNFDALPASGSAPWSNNSTLPGWYHARTGTGTAIVADTGASNSGNLYSYGATASSDRALGSIGSSNAAAGNFFWGVRLANNTGATITSLDVAYNGEQWRNSAAAAQTMTFSYLIGSPTVSGSLAEFQSPGVAVSALDFTSPVTGGSAGALNGNLPANQQAHTVTITGLNIPNGSEVMLRWSDPDNTGSDHGLAIDDVSITPHGDQTGTPGLSIADVSKNEGDSGTTTFTFTVSLPAPAPAGGVSFDIATSDGTATAPSDYTSKTLLAQTIPAGSTSYSFDVLVNGDTTTEANETFRVTLTNATGASIVRGQATGTIVNDDVSLVKIHDVQGNGATTPMPGATVTVEGVVIANFLGSGKLSGFFLQEEDADADADPNTSEGIFVFCGLCTPTNVAEGQRVRVTGAVSEFQGMTELTPTSASTVVVTDAGNHMAEITPSPITLPISGDVDAFYEAREAMLVTYTDTLSVSEYFELFRFGQIELVQGDRPRTFTEDNAPSVAGYAAHLEALSRRHVILDDDNNAQEAPLMQPDGSQSVYYPHANGGFSVGTQGLDYFRGGDQVQHLTGVLHWSWAGFGDNTWRIRPSQAYPVTFTVANPRPTTPPDVGGAIRVVGMNLLNYFTTIDTTSSSSSGPCGPTGNLDCRGADSVAELNRQRERASIVVCTLNPDVAAFMELENTTPTASITDLLGAVNARCGAPNPYTFVDTGGTLGTDAIRVMLIYRTGVVTPVGSVLTDMDPIHNRPPTAQTFQVNRAGAANGNLFTVVANHFKSKGSCPSGGSDADQNDGQSCWAATRTAQAQRLLTWVNGIVVPAAGSPDVLLLGDFNSYAHETPVTTLESAGYVDMETELHGTQSYSYLFSGELGHLDYAFASASLAGKVTGADAWHINADEADLFDYNDEIHDVGEATFEEKPDGSALTPPRVVFQPGTPYRASDHDPVLVGLFSTDTSADLSVSMTAAPDPVVAGDALAYTITLTNAGPNAADAAAWTDALPAGTRFASLSGAAGWTCTTPAVGAAGTVSCNQAAFAPGSAVFTLTVTIDADVADATVVSNTATVSSTTSDSNAGNNSATATATVSTSADLAVTISDAPDPVTAGAGVTYTITLTNTGPSDASMVTLSDTLPTGTTFADIAVSAEGWTCAAPPAGSSGTVTCSGSALPSGDSVLVTLSVDVAANVAGGTVLTNTVTAASSTSEPTPGNASATATTTVLAAPQGNLTIVPVTVDFGDQLVGSSSPAATVTLSNSGNAPLQVTALTPASAPFARSGGDCAGSLPIALAAGAHCTLGYTFTPTVAGIAQQTLSVAANAPGSGTILLKGNGSLPATADVTLTLDDDRDVVQVGDTLNYVITVSNKSGPATATVTVSDVLPAELSDGAWTCVPNGAATCASGSGNALSDTATLPPGTQASYVYSASVQAGGSTDAIVNAASANAGATDPNPANNSASDTDTLVIFKDGFDDAAPTETLDDLGAGLAAASLSVDASLLERIGIMPTAIASGETTAGGKAFTVELARFGAQFVARMIVRHAQVRDERSAWRVVDLGERTLDLAWQSAAVDAATGYGYLQAGSAPTLVIRHDVHDPVERLRVATRDGVRWLEKSSK